MSLITFLYFSLTLQSETLQFFVWKAIIFHWSHKNSVSNCLSSVRCNLLKWGKTCVPRSRVLSCNIHTAKSPLRRPQHNMWSNCEATITQARPDVINRPSDRRVKGQMSGVKVQLLLETVFICMCVDTAFLSSGGRGCWFITSRGMDSEVESSCSSVIYSSSGAEYWLESTTLLQLRGEAIQTAGTTLEVPTPAHLGKDTVELIISHA